MKKLFASRTQILHAIRAACLTLFLFAATQAQGQVTATSTGGGNVSITGSGAYFYDGTGVAPLGVNGTLTISGSSSITNTASASEIIAISHGATIANGASLNFTTTSNTGAFLFSDISITETNGDAIEVDNASTGTLNVAPSQNASASAIYASGAGSVQVNNNGGTITSSSYYRNTGISASSAEGNVGVSNTGAITSIATGDVGDSSAQSYGISASGYGAGKVTVFNSGAVTAASGYDTSAAIYVSAVAGVNSAASNGILITNSGALSSTASSAQQYAYGIVAATSGDLLVRNNAGGDITVDASNGGIGFGLFATSGAGSTGSTIYNSAGIQVSTGAGNTGAAIYSSSVVGTIIVNSGALEVTTSTGGEGTSQLYGIESSSNGTGNTVENSGSITVDGVNDVYGIDATLDGGVISVSNSAAISSTSGLGASYGIFADSQSADLSIANSSTITASGYYQAQGISALTDSGSIYIHNTGAIGSTTTNLGLPSDATGLLAESFSSSAGSIRIVNGADITTSGVYARGMDLRGSTGIEVTNAAGATVSASGGESAFGALIGTQGSVTITNNGTFTGTSAGLYAVGIQVSASASDVAITNSSTGVITGTGTSQANAAGVQVLAPNDDVAVTNSGSITSSAVDGFSRGISLLTGDAVTVTNDATGTITSSTSGLGTASGIYIDTFPSALPVTVTNNGTITTSTSGSGGVFGIEATTNGSGSLTVTNTNVISATSATGGVSLGIAAGAMGDGAVTVQNNGGTITASSYYGSIGMAGAVGAGALTMTNTGTISGTSTATNPEGPAFGYGISASSYAGGSISVTNSGTVSGSTASGYNSGYGIYASAPGGGAIVITNTGTATGTATAAPSTTAGIEAEASTGNVTITNSGAGVATGSGAYVAWGIHGVANAGGDVSLTNTSSGTVSATTSISGYGSASGIYAEAESGSAYLKNTGAVTAMGGNAVALLTNSGTGSIVINSGMLTATTTDAGYNAAGIVAQDMGTGTISITNTGGITSSGDYASGIVAQGNAGITISNTAAIGSTGAGTTSAIYAITTGAPVSITNSGALTVTDNDTGFSSHASGINVTVIPGDDLGDITIGNTGALSVTSSSGFATGITLDGTGNIDVTNSAVVTGTSTNTVAGYGQGLDAHTGGNITVTNTGTLSGVVSGAPSDGGNTDGVALLGSGNFTVTNSSTGVISGTSNGAASAYGIHMGGEGNATVTNSHLISANTSDGSGSGVFIRIGGDVTVTNSTTGTISAGSSGTGAVTGVSAETTGPGTVTATNHGTITASGYLATGLNATSSSDAIIIGNTNTISAYGNGTALLNLASSAVIANSTGGPITISNTGTLLATAESSATGVAAEVIGAGDIAFTNSGSITATGTGDLGKGVTLHTTDGNIIFSHTAGAITASGYYSASGVYLHAGGTASVTFSGAASVSATNTFNDNGPATIFAVLVESDGDGQLIHTGSGTITATATNFRDVVTVGLGIGSSASAYLKNTGTVSATGANAFTLSAYSVTGTTLINSGALLANGSTFGPATGIRTDSGLSQTTLTNSGTVDVTGSSAYGIATTSSTGAMTLSNSGALTVSGTGIALGVSSTSQGGAITVTNTAAITATGQSALGLVATEGNGGAGEISITNSGPINATSNGVYQASFGIEAGSSGSVTVVNSATIVSNDTNLTDSEAFGIGSFGNDVSVTNSGSVTSMCDASGGVAFGLAGFGATVMLANNGTVHATGNAVGGTFGLDAGAGDSAMVTNSGHVTATGFYDATGIFGNAGTILAQNSSVVSALATGIGRGIGMGITSSRGALQVVNTGTITASGYASSFGINAVADGGAGDVNNNGHITVSASDGDATGIYLSATGDAITLENSGTVVATSDTTSAYGLVALNTTGETTVTNSGSATGTGTTGYGIYVDPTGPITVNNTGTAIGSTSGIYLAGAATVNNSGTARGGAYSIFVPTGSTVNLSGASPISGLIKGGADDTSTSVLNFAISVRLNFASAKAALDAAIADYAAQLAAAPKSPGVDVTSEVVTLNSSQYQWQDFAFVNDDLGQGRLYEFVGGFDGIGGVLDHLDTTNPNAARILSALDALPTGAVADALSQLTPKELEVFRNVAFDNNTFNVAKINNHLANLRDGLTGFDSSQLTLHDAGMDSSLDQVRTHLLAYSPIATPGLLSDTVGPLFGGTDMKDVKSARIDTEPTSRWSAFISGDVILADLSDNPNLNDANYTTGNVMAGVDYRLDNHFTVGALFAYAHTDADLDNRGSEATVDSYSPGIYASYVNKGWYGNGLATYGRNAYTSDRRIDIPGLDSDNHENTSGDQGTVNLTGGYEFQHGAFKFGPVASAQYVHLNIDSLRESGGPAALNIDSQVQDSFRSLLGLEARYVADVATPLGRTTVTPHVSASWQHEYLENNDEGFTSQFNGAGGGSFQVDTDSPDRDSAFFDVGVDATVNKNVTLFLDYEAQAGQDNFSAQSAQGGVKVGF